MKNTKLKWKGIPVRERRVTGTSVQGFAVAQVVFGGRSRQASIRFFITGKLVAVNDITRIEAVDLGLQSPARDELKRMMQAMYTLWAHGLLDRLYPEEAKRREAGQA